MYISHDTSSEFRSNIKLMRFYIVIYFQKVFEWEAIACVARRGNLKYIRYVINL